MCGITGIVGSPEQGVLRRMLDRLSHRGPDGLNTWLDEGVGLGHALLAILDVAHGRQPMTDASGRYTLVYNGECYNHREVRQRLEAEGIRFRTQTDSETVLEAVAAWGPGALARLEGMFAFAVWDSVERSLLVARDPWGVKPFFHAWTAEGDFVFASELKAVLAHPGITASPDTDRLKERGCLEFLTGQATLLRGIRQVPPGTWAKVRAGDGAVHWHAYHHIQDEAFATVGDAARAIRDRLVQSVQAQLQSDVPVGVVLSGGLDSAAVAAIHQSVSPEPIHTFTVADSEDVEDLQASRRVADALGTEHHESLFGVEDMLAQMPAWTWHNESVNYTEFFFFPLFQRMRRTVTVGLCGQGSDELWGGYARYRDPTALAEQRLACIHRCRPAHMDELAATVAMTHQSGPALAEWDQQGQLANFQLRLVDRTSMAFGMEVRVPFLSRALHSASRAVAWDWKMHAGVEKWILRKAVEALDASPRLPRDLVWRPKVPAGRATGPDAVARFEREAERLVDRRLMERHPLACAFPTPAQFLVYRLWEEQFVHGGGQKRALALAEVAC